MVPNTSFAILLLATAFALTARPNVRQARYFAIAASVAVLLYGVLNLVQIASGIDLGIDQFLPRDNLAPLAGSAPGRMALPTTIATTGLAIFLLLVVTDRARRVADILAFAVGAGAYALVLGLSFNAPEFESGLPAMRVALPASIAVLLLAGSAVLARPDRPYLAAVFADDARGAFLRWFAPTLILFPGAAGAFLGLTDQTSTLPPLAESYLVAGATVVVFGAFGILGARAIHAADDARRRADEEARENEKRVRAILESLPDPLLLVDPRGRIGLVNPAAGPAFGYSPDELLGQEIEILLPEATRRRHAAERNEYERAPRRLPMAHRVDLVARKKDGTVFPVGVSLGPMRTPDGLFVVVSVQDLTVRREAEGALMESEERFREIADRVEDIFWVASADFSRLLYINPAYERTTGWPAADFLANIGELAAHAHPEDVDALLQAIAATSESKDPTHVEYRYTHRDGSTHWIHVRQYPVVDETGLILRRVGVAQDVTERHVAAERSNEAAAQAAEISRLSAVQEGRKQFVSTLAHEIGNPLTPIMLQMELLTMDGLDRFEENDRKAVRVIDSNLRRMRSLLRDVLDVSRLESGRLSMKTAACDLVPIAREIVETYGPAAAGAGIGLTFAAADPGPIVADRERIGQVVANLVTNALKFTPAGGSIEVSAALEGTDAVVRVKDTGRGLDAGQIAKLFRPFSQVHASSPQIPRGTGLGLFISKGIVEQHGGRIWVESDGVGHGSTFAFALPLAPK
ncbi:MAG: PAS domain S-box protein [Thermoplasmatota archaeon]